ncbi:BED zinc finger hAT family dimerization domain [Euphorbia peplus]|nr:BED zinc finger hAT family dimerization domain [Euphorbia peplus]
MCITAHYIDVDWHLNKKILNFCPISSHRGEDIGKSIETCLYDWGIRNVFTITVDNASSNDVAISYLKKKFINWEDCIANCKYIHMRCIAHILNLVVVEGLKDVCEPVKKVRNYVRYVRQSPSRLQKFNQCVELEKIDCKKFVCLDVPTKWNSTYSMLSTAEKFESAFIRFGTSMDPFFEYEMIAQDGLLSSDEWVVVRSVSIMLKQFYDATLRILGSLYVTSNALWTEIAHLHSEILEWINHVDEWLIAWVRG